jgi:hypothetical protein
MDAHCLPPEGKAEIDAHCMGAQNTHITISGDEKLSDKNNALSSTESLSQEARISEAVITSASSPVGISEPALRGAIQEVSICMDFEAVHIDKGDSSKLGVPGQTIITDDSDGPHAPITADMLTYGLMCERFAVDSYINVHEIIGIDNLLSVLRGIPTNVSLILKGMKPYIPFTRWTRVTSRNAAFFENKASFPYLPALVLSGTVPFQLAYFFPTWRPPHGFRRLPAQETRLPNAILERCCMLRGL